MTSPATLEAPTQPQQGQPPGPPDDPKQILLKQGEHLLRKMVQEQIQNDSEPDKSYLYAEFRRNKLYYDGEQYIVPVRSATGIIDYRPLQAGSLTMQPVTSGETQPIFDYVLNIFRGDIDKFVAVVGIRSPNVVACPDRRSDDELSKRSRKAGQVGEFIHSTWNVDAVQRLMTSFQAKYGTCFLHTPYVANADKHGYTVEPTWELVDVPLGEPFYLCRWCGEETPQSELNGQQQAILNPAVRIEPKYRPNMGFPVAPEPGPQVPMKPEQGSPGPNCPHCGAQLTPNDLQQPPMVPSLQQGTAQSYPNGSVELYLANASEITYPVWAKNVEALPWIWWEYEEHAGTLIKTYPQLREMKAKLDAAGQGEYSGSGQGRRTRDLATSPTGLTTPNRRSRWTYSRYWLRPAMYETLPDDDSGKEIRDMLYQYCPTGAKLVYVNNELIDIEHERLDEVWAACKPQAAEYLYSQPLFNPYIQIQDAVNDFWNFLQELFQRAIPIIMYDPMVLDRKVIDEHNKYPGEFVPMKSTYGADVSKSFYRPPVASPDPAMSSFIESAISKAREIVGVQPTIFGGGSPNMTARQAEIEKNQALMQLNIPWNEEREAWEKAHENATIQYARYSGGRLYSSKGTADSVQVTEVCCVEELLEGGWHFEAEEAIPMNAGQRRDQIANLLQNPPSWQLLGVDHPDNLDALRDHIGMPDWVVPNAAAKDRLLGIIGQLLEAAPGPPGPDGNPQPSIAIDTFMFDPPFALAIIKEWMQSRKGEIAQENKPDGYENVKAYGLGYFQAMQPPPPTPPPEPIRTTLAISAQLPQLPPEVQQEILQDAQIAPPAPPPGPPGQPSGSPTPAGGPQPGGPAQAANVSPLAPAPPRLAAPPPNGGPPPPPAGPPPPALAAPAGMTPGGVQ